MTQRWLKDWPWETVVVINAGLCKEKNALHKPTSDGYKPAQKLWESSALASLPCGKLWTSAGSATNWRRSAFTTETPSWR